MSRGSAAPVGAPAGARPRVAAATLAALMALAAGGGCRPTEVGVTAACLLEDDGTPVWDTGAGVQTFNVEGTITAIGTGGGSNVCDLVVPGRIEFEERNGVRWVLQYGVFDARGRDITPAVHLYEGDDIALLFRGVDDDHRAFGFVLTDDQGLIGAVEAGDGRGSALLEWDVPGITVRDGVSLGTVHAPCADEVHHTLVFEGDEGSTAITPVGEGTVTSGGTEFQAQAIANVAIENVSCPEFEGGTRWAIWR